MLSKLWKLKSITGNNLIAFEQTGSLKFSLHPWFDFVRKIAGWLFIMFQRRGENCSDMRIWESESLPAPSLYSFFSLDSSSFFASLRFPYLFCISFSPDTYYSGRSCGLCNACRVRNISFLSLVGSFLRPLLATGSPSDYVLRPRTLHRSSSPHILLQLQPVACAQTKIDEGQPHRACG